MNKDNVTGYTWVPAAALYQSVGGMGVYVRYKPRNDSPIRVVHHSSRNMLLECPDRDLLITCETINAEPGPMRPMNGTWDEFVNMSMFHGHAASDYGTDMYMVNYTSHMDNPAVSHRTREHRTRLPSEPWIISDSGGFQLSMGRLTYIDPYKLVSWYNDNCDIGIALDIPPGGADWNASEMRRLAEAQARNTEILMANKKDSVEIMNVFHGTDQTRVMWRDVCERDDIDRVAVGGMYRHSLMIAIDEILKLIFDVKGRYKHMHILGVMNPLQMVILMRIASKGWIPLLTSDSSTHMQAGVNGEYFFHPFVTENFRRVLMRDKGGMPTHHMQELPCACPVCSAIKYTDIFNVLTNTLVTRLFTFHNQLVVQEYVRVMRDVVQNTTTKELKTLLRSQLGTRTYIEEALKCIDLVDQVAEHGYDKGRGKFKVYVERSLFGPEMKSLRAKAYAESDAEVSVLEATNPPVEPNEYKQRIREVLERFEQGHTEKGKVIKGPRLKQSPMFSKGTKLGRKP